MDNAQVLIVGAGPTGLTMAIELLRQGLRVRLIDRAPGPAQYSQALVVQARTLEQFERYRFADEAVARGRQLRSASAKSHHQPLFEFTLDRIPGRYPYVLFLPQQETEALLTSYLQELGGTIERGSELIILQDLPDGVKATLRTARESEEEVHVDYLIGCDGSHSTVRQLSGIPFEGNDVGLSFQLGDLELEGRDVPHDALKVFLYDGDVVFIGQLSESIHRVIVAGHDHQGHQPNRPQPTVQDFAAAIDRCTAEDIHVRSSTWMTNFFIHQKKAKSYRQGHVFLAGDASHIHSPVAGQGMNTGIQDAANLGWKLGAVVRGGDHRLLDSYNEERGAVGEALLRTTSRGLAAATTDNWLVQTIRDQVLPWIAKMGALQGQIAGFVSETAIHYRPSSIVLDCGGHGTIKAGDRMPNGEISEDGSPRLLLDDLQRGDHLFLTVDVPEGDAFIRNHLTHARVRAVQSKSLAPDLAHQLARGSILAIRPDGYVGFRGTTENGHQLNAYGQLIGAL